jgi:hypothetical protein
MTLGLWRVEAKRGQPDPSHATPLTYHNPPCGVAHHKTPVPDCPSHMTRWSNDTVVAVPSFGAKMPCGCGDGAGPGEGHFETFASMNRMFVIPRCTSAAAIPAGAACSRPKALIMWSAWQSGGQCDGEEWLEGQKLRANRRKTYIPVPVIVRPYANRSPGRKVGGKEFAE